MIKVAVVCSIRKLRTITVAHPIECWHQVLMEFNESHNDMRSEMMMVAMKKSIFAATLGCLLFPAMGISATLEQIDQRLKKLEGEDQVNRAETDDIANRLKNGMSVSGYADTEYVTTNVPGDAGFRIHHLSMFLKKQVSSDLRFFSETEWEDALIWPEVQAAVYFHRSAQFRLPMAP